MANPLTGYFDLVAEFSVAAVNRVLAAMHSNQRFLHSISARVDDNPQPGLPTKGPILVGSVDSFGDPSANHSQIGNPDPFPGQLVATSAINSALGQLINADSLATTIGPIIPSHLQGRVQAQLFPPTVSVPDTSGTRLTVTLEMMSRYFPDHNTAPLAEFVRGELQITASVNRLTAQTANVLEIDFKAHQANVNFIPTWTSQSLSLEDLSGINLAIHNALKTSFLPSNITLPAGITFAQVKTVTGPLSGIAVLLNTQGGPGNPSSMSSNFMGNQDQFAFGVAPGFISRKFVPVIDSIVGQPAQTITIPIDLLFTTAHVVYSIKLNSADFALLEGKIVLTVKGHATQTSHKWYAPDNFDFTATFGFTLRANGATADLVPGDVSLDTSSSILNLFKGSATAGITHTRDQALQQSGTFDVVRNTLDANKNMGGFFSSLLKPSSIRFFSQGEGVVLGYTSVEIHPTGIVLHGSLSVVNSLTISTRRTASLDRAGFTFAGDWPAPSVSYEQIPVSTSGPITEGILPTGPHYSALKSWIPGGTIERFEWNVHGTLVADGNRFIYIPPPPVLADGYVRASPITAFAPVCLTIRGNRISSSGAAVMQPVSASVCSYTSVSLIPTELATGVKGVLPTVMLTQSGADGRITVTGNTPVLAAAPGSGTPNLLVYFGDRKGVGELNLLVEALGDSNRPYLPTAIIAVLSPGLITTVRHTRGIVYGEERDGDWERLFGVPSPQRPLTLVVAATGKIVWRREGPLDKAGLTEALREHLSSGGPVPLSLFQSNARILQPAPNFLFEYAPGRQLAMRKLAGKPAVLIFWRTSSQASIEAVRDAEKNSGAGERNDANVLAINDGEPRELARRVAAENKLAAIIVTDPKREISAAYGVTLWPTIIELDEAGLVTAIRHGRDTGHHGEVLSQPVVEERG